MSRGCFALACTSGPGSRLKAMDHTCRTPGAYAAWLEALPDNQRQSATANALPVPRDLDPGELLATKRRAASAVSEQRDSPRDMGHAGTRRRAIVIRRNGVSMPRAGWDRIYRRLAQFDDMRLVRRSVSPNYFRNMSRNRGFLNSCVIRSKFHTLLQFLAHWARA
jgi:hypothetical protein